MTVHLAYHAARVLILALPAAILTAGFTMYDVTTVHLALVGASVALWLCALLVYVVAVITIAANNKSEESK